MVLLAGVGRDERALRKSVGMDSGCVVCGSAQALWNQGRQYLEYWLAQTSQVHGIAEP